MRPSALTDHPVGNALQTTPRAATGTGAPPSGTWMVVARAAGKKHRKAPTIGTTRATVLRIKWKLQDTFAGQYGTPFRPRTHERTACTPDAFLSIVVS